jgi:hypothetical protein
MTTGALPHDLRQSIVTCGYFPDFISATVARALGDETVVASVVHHEATFDHDEIHRHVTVLVLTPRRFLVNHTDDGETPGDPQALSTVETVPVRQIRSVSLTNVVSHPEKYGRGKPIAEAWLSVGWGVLRRQEVVPATCGDPNCEADHGYTSEDVADDLTVRMSVAADGEDNVNRLVAFATALQLATV